MAEKKRKRILKKEIEEVQEKKVSSEAKEYDPAATYNVGDVIFHKVWGEEGTVVEIGETEDSIKKIIVDFPELGKKKLVMDMGNKPE
jgi:hypothetical protein